MQASETSVVDPIGDPAFARPGLLPDEPAASQVTRWLDGTIFLGLAFLLLALPFVYSLQMTEGFGLPKELFARVILALLGASFCWRFFFEGTLRLQPTPVDRPLLWFVGFAGLSMLWNQHAEASFVDLRTTALVLAIVPLIVNTVRTRWQCDTLLWMMTLAGVGTALLGILEAWDVYFRFRPGEWPVFAREEIRNRILHASNWYIPFFPENMWNDKGMGGSITSTLGNRNYLATFTMAVSFIPLGLLFASVRRMVKGLAFLSFSLILTGMIVTRCRAAFLGFVAGLACTVFVALTLKPGRRFLRRHWAMVVAICLAIAVAMSFAVNTAKMPSFFEKIQTTLSLDSSNSTHDRLITWYVTWRSFAGEPIKWLAGNGFSSFRYWFELLRAQILDDATKDRLLPLIYRQAHSDWLQLVAELGLIGLGLLLFAGFRWFASVYRFLLRIPESACDEGFPPEQRLALWLGGALVAVLVAALPDFPFHRIETALAALCMVGIGLVLAETRGFTVSPPQKNLSPHLRSHLGITLFALVLAGISIRSDLIMMKADRMVEQARMAQLSRGPAAFPEAIRLLREAISLNPVPGCPYMMLASLHHPAREAQMAIALAMKAWKNLHYDGKHGYTTLLRLLNMSVDQGLNNQELALFISEQALSVSTGEGPRAADRLQIARYARKLGKVDRAEDELRMVARCPDFAGQYPLPLALTLGDRGKWAEALALGASYSLSIGHSNVELLGEIGVWANNLQQWATATAALERAVSLEPGNTLFRLNLAAVRMGAGALEAGFQAYNELFRSSELSEVGKREVGVRLASAALRLLASGMNDLETGRRPDGLRKLGLIRQSPHLPEEARQKVESLFR